MGRKVRHMRLRGDLESAMPVTGVRNENPKHPSMRERSGQEEGKEGEGSGEGPCEPVPVLTKRQSRVETRTGEPGAGRVDQRMFAVIHPETNSTRQKGRQ